MKEHCCPTAGCGVSFWVTEGFDGRRREDHQSFFCPNGHTLTYGQKTAAEIDRDEARRERDSLRRELATAKAALLKAKPKPRRKHHSPSQLPGSRAKK